MCKVSSLEHHFEPNVVVQEWKDKKKWKKNKVKLFSSFVNEP